LQNEILTAIFLRMTKYLFNDFTTQEIGLFKTFCFAKRNLDSYIFKNNNYLFNV